MYSGHWCNTIANSFDWNVVPYLKQHIPYIVDCVTRQKNARKLPLHHTLYIFDGIEIGRFGRPFPSFECFPVHCCLIRARWGWALLSTYTKLVFLGFNAQARGRTWSRGISRYSSELRVSSMIAWLLVCWLMARQTIRPLPPNNSVPLQRFVMARFPMAAPYALWSVDRIQQELRLNRKHVLSPLHRCPVPSFLCPSESVPLVCFGQVWLLDCCTNLQFINMIRNCIADKK